MNTPRPTAPPLPHESIDDRWLDELRAHAVDGRPLPAGRVLRVKLGYNPNSSSVGSVVSTLLWSATACAAVLNIAAVLVADAARGGRAAAEGDVADDDADVDA